MPFRMFQDLYKVLLTLRSVLPYSQLLLINLRFSLESIWDSCKDLSVLVCYSDLLLVLVYILGLITGVLSSSTPSLLQFSDSVQLLCYLLVLTKMEELQL
jgi:hypothetical protein